jgi:hypothetical protein
MPRLDLSVVFLRVDLRQRRQERQAAQILAIPLRRKGAQAVGLQSARSARNDENSGQRRERRAACRQSEASQRRAGRVASTSDTYGELGRPVLMSHLGLELSRPRLDASVPDWRDGGGNCSGAECRPAARRHAGGANEGAVVASGDARTASMATREMTAYVPRLVSSRASVPGGSKGGGPRISVAPVACAI